MWIYEKLQSLIYFPPFVNLFCVCLGMCIHVCAWGQLHAIVCPWRFYDQPCLMWRSTIWNIGIEVRSWGLASGTFVPLSHLASQILNTLWTQVSLEKYWMFLWIMLVRWYPGQSEMRKTHPAQFLVFQGEDPCAFCEEFHFDHRPRVGSAEISLSSPSAVK